jgi:putative ABC transport system ATP-binding protein
VFQFFNLVPILTVEENIMLPILIDGKKPDSDHINRLISELGISEKKKILPYKLSGGQQQRVAIARAFAAKPSVVFADEPTDSLDSKTGAEIIQLFRHMAEEYHQTIVLVTHDHNVASQCRRVIEMSDGHIVSTTGG